MTVFKIILSVLVLLFSYMAYNFIKIADVLRNPEVLNNKSCRLIKGAGAIGVEDVNKFKNYIIAGSNDNAEMWEIKKLFPNPPNGSMVYIDTLKEPLEIKNSKILNFPSEVDFHPHGIYIYKDQFIYVINHAYSRGGERVEVFEMKSGPEELTYLRSIQLPKELTGRANDLVVIGENDEFIVTSYMPQPDTEEKGRDHSPSTALFNMLTYFLNIPLTNVYHCKGGDCKIIPDTKSLMNNGIAYDEANQKVYVVNLFEKRVRVYKLNKGSENILTHESYIDTTYSIDNILFDKETGIISAGFIGKGIESLAMVDSLKKGQEVKSVHGGSLTIDTRHGNEVKVRVLTNELMNGIASAVSLNNKMYHGSWFGEGVLVCDLISE